MENYKADIADDGQAGYDMASRDNYDIIVLDNLLPKLDGIEVCKKLRQKDIDTPIITRLPRIRSKISARQRRLSVWYFFGTHFEPRYCNPLELVRSKGCGWQKKS